MYPRIIIAFALVSLLFLSCGQSPTTTNPEPEGHQLLSASLFSGPIYSVDVSGNYAFCGGDGSLHVLDISDRQNPVLVAGLPLPGLVYDVKIQGDYAYLAIGDTAGNLLVVDISNPLRPVAGKRLETLHIIYRLTLHSDYIFGLAVGDQELFIFDLGNPANPRLINTFSDIATYNLTGFAIFDNFAFVAGQRRSLILDITDPARPEIVDSTLTATFRFFVNEHYLYRLDYEEDITVFNISIPLHPDSVAAITGSFRDITFAGDYAYLTTNPWNSSEATIINISNPENPVVSGTYSAQKSIYRLTVIGNYIFHLEAEDLSTQEGLRIIDIGNPAAPIPMGLYVPYGGTYKVVAIGDYAYILTASRLCVMAIGDDSHPEVVGSIAADSNYDLDVKGDYAYVAFSAQSGLKIYDVSIPENPRTICEFGGDYRHRRNPGIHVNGNRAYYATNDNGLYILDITNPALPVEIAHIEGLINNSCVSGNYCYVASQSRGLVVYDVTNPAQITEVGNYPSSWPSWFIVVEGNLAYLSGLNGFLVLDVSDPAHPVLKGQSNLSDHASGSLTVSGTTVYTSSRSSGVKIFETTSLGNPVLLKTIDTPNYAWSTAVTDRHIIVADGSSLLIYNKD